MKFDQKQSIMNTVSGFHPTNGDKKDSKPSPLNLRKLNSGKEGVKNLVSTRSKMIKKVQSATTKDDVVAHKTGK